MPASANKHLKYIPTEFVWHSNLSDRRQKDRQSFFTNEGEYVNQLEEK